MGKLTAKAVTSAKHGRHGDGDGLWLEVAPSGPAARMKSGRPHRVPLAPRALEILEQLAPVRVGEFVFFGQEGKPLSGMAMPMLFCVA